MCFSQVVKSLFLVFLLGGTLTRVRCLSFNYTLFDTIYPESGSGQLIMSNYSHIEFGAIQVTPDVTGAIPNYSGRVFYNNTFRLWDKTKGVTANFSTTFVLNISPKTSPGGEGLSFILAADTTPPQNSDGQWLGIVNASTNGSSQANVVAVEFDTRKSYQEDLDDNHVGLDVNTIYSEPQVPLTNLGINLSSSSNITATVQYDGKNMTLRVSSKDVFSWPLNLSEHLPEEVYVGFSASTGNDTELNCIWSWEFNGSDIGDSGFGGGGDNDLKLLWLWITAPAAVVLVLSGIVFCLYWRRKQALYAEDPYPGLEDQIRGSSTAPQKFLLKELRKATGNFNPKNKLGKGGFGTVYKGLLANKEVAVKRISKNSSQGKQEFIAEVTTIGSLYHKNLVRLIGWCYERCELLLVYEFMPNGSLDKFIFGNEKLGMEEPTLTWEKRHIIIHGVAEALDYLHNGCENRVLHRDIKASNIMLDSEYNAKLGDFGLARTIQQRGKTHHSTIEMAGTPGYMAPETFHISRATVETDVYSFGVLVLEVLCGRKPGNQIEENNYNSSIVYWLWELHRNGRILDAVDSRLNMEFDEERMSCMLVLALLCCHPNPHQRPSMKTVLQVLTGEAPPPLVPTEIPAFVWPAKPPSFKGDSGNSLSESKRSSFTELTGR
ncbi:probable L-type lectin-domain containing receptor kinase S.5 [Quercus robur]|uniref:probable L-type lectin-domain containing receptor kinase S.5 n=1 Tax=Quercus robur TaxID=38942 RepID=UPI00216182EA|nr:probable L-type lectin-domain containing receptor kinase S.5 [Quercus robur]